MRFSDVALVYTERATGKRILVEIPDAEIAADKTGLLNRATGERSLTARLTVTTTSEWKVTTEKGAEGIEENGILLGEVIE